MNIRFTIEEENIIAIYAEDSRERTIDNIISAMPPACRRSGKQAASHDGQHIFRNCLYSHRRRISLNEAGARLPIAGTAPPLFIVPAR